MSTYFGWQRVIWFHQLLMQYEIFWQGMRYELMHYELVYCTLVLLNAKFSRTYINPPQSYP